MKTREVVQWIEPTVSNIAGSLSGLNTQVALELIKWQRDIAKYETIKQDRKTTVMEVAFSICVSFGVLYGANKMTNFIPSISRFFRWLCHALRGFAPSCGDVYRTRIRQCDIREHVTSYLFGENRCGTPFQELIASTDTSWQTVACRAYRETIHKIAHFGTITHENIHDLQFGLIVLFSIFVGVVIILVLPYFRTRRLEERS